VRPAVVQARAPAARPYLSEMAVVRFFRRKGDGLYYVCVGIDALFIAKNYYHESFLKVSKAAGFRCVLRLWNPLIFGMTPHQISFSSASRFSIKLTLFILHPFLLFLTDSVSVSEMMFQTIVGDLLLRRKIRVEVRWSGLRDGG
jgi:hypothetical protein